MSRVRRRNAVLETLELFRGRSPALWVNNIVAYLYVAENEGLNVKELAHVSRMNEATASRSVRSLAAPGTAGALSPALGLVELYLNPEDGRGRLLHLTDDGRRLRDEIDQVIRDGVTIAG